MMKVGRLWLVLIFAAFCGYFGFNNQDWVGVSLPPFLIHVTFPIYGWLLSSFILGTLVTTVYFGIDSLKKRAHIRRLERELDLVRPTIASNAFAAAGPSVQGAPPTSGWKGPKL